MRIITKPAKPASTEDEAARILREHGEECNRRVGAAKTEEERQSAHEFCKNSPEVKVPFGHYNNVDWIDFTTARQWKRNLRVIFWQKTA